MLKILHNISDLDYSQMLNVYGEAVVHDAANVGMIAAEQSLYDDLCLFLSEKNAVCYLWEIDGHYTSCVRCETYSDGLLLSCLETAPEARRKGYAASLLKEVLAIAGEQAQIPVYVHIHYMNKASIALHKRLGFHVVTDYARLIDGTVSRSYCTMKFE